MPDEKEYYCPFCSGRFRAGDILFVDEDHVSGGMNNAEYDAEHNALESKVLSVREIKMDDANICIEQRPKYKFHRWKKPENNLPFAELLEEPHVLEDSGCPDDIRVIRNKGLTPGQLRGDLPAPWEKTPAKQSEDAPKEQMNQALSGQSILKMLADSMNSGKNAAQQAAVSEIMPDEATATLTKKACPLCHCVLPDQFGHVPVYRVALLGGTASGKTTYMVSTANQLISMNGLPSGLINSCQVCDESKRYFDFLIKCLEYNRLEATMKDDATIIRFVFPIVLNVTASTEDGMGERDFILIISDIPGEGMRDRAFLMEYPGLRQADGAIMLMDPLQFINNTALKRTLIEKHMEALHVPGSGENGEYTEQDINEHKRSFTPDPFATTLAQVKDMMKSGKFEHLRSLTMVLNKIDLLYGGDRPIIDVAKDKYTYLNGQFDLSVQHTEGLNLDYIDDLSSQTVNLIKQKLGYTQYEGTLNTIAGSAGKDGIKTLCVSILNWDVGHQKFISSADENGFTSRENMMGFRLLEPLLLTLAYLELIRTKRGVEETEPEEVREELHLSLFDMIFGRRRRKDSDQRMAE